MGDQFEGFIPIHTIFYAVFHPTEGTKVRYEFPPGNLESHNINFDAIKNYIIPKPQLCHKLLTLKYKNYRIASYPVTVNSPIYARNFFSFNFVFVFPYDCQTSPYEPAIARLGKMFKVLEEQNLILSKAEKDPIFYHFKQVEIKDDQDAKSKPEKGSHNLSKSQAFASEKYHKIMTDIESADSTFSLKDLVLRVYQDLNNYSECLIPIDEGNAVDIKIFPMMTPPNSNISIEDVPVSTVNLNKVIDVNWDPTMLKIVPYINGLNSISKIAKLSVSDPGLVIECIKHLIYYNCVLLADIFQFSNIYAPTSSLRTFLTDSVLSTECQSYVVCEEDSTLPRLPFKRVNHSATESVDHELADSHRSQRTSGSRTTSMSSNGEFFPSSNNEMPALISEESLYRTGKHSQSSFSSNNTNPSNILARYLPTKSCLFDLYRSLSQGTSLREWYGVHYGTIRANRIDVRRFITFGVINGLIYRCYSYPIMKNLEIFDLAKRLHREDISNHTVKHNKAKNPSKNIFSTSDIKFGVEYERQRNKHHKALNLDIADEVLRNVYKKLSVTNSTDTRPNSADPIARLYRERSLGSLADGSTNNIYRLQNSDRPSKVSFDKQQEIGHISKGMSSSNDKVKMDEEAKLERRERDLILLESVEAADSLDTICVKLEMSRYDVEALIQNLGEYKIINS